MSLQEYSSKRFHHRSIY